MCVEKKERTKTQIFILFFDIHALTQDDDGCFVNSSFLCVDLRKSGCISVVYMNSMHVRFKLIFYMICRASIWLTNGNKGINGVETKQQHKNNKEKNVTKNSFCYYCIRLRNGTSREKKVTNKYKINYIFVALISVGWSEMIHNMKKICTQLF